MNNINGNPANLGLVRTVFLSVSHRDATVYPSASDFVIDLPSTITKVHGVAIRNFKYTPEQLINSKNNTLSFSVNGGESKSVALSKGDYNQNITELLTEINTLLSTESVEFTVVTVEDSQKIKVSFTGATTITIPSSKLLKLLGFQTGILLHKDETALATASYKIVNDTDLVLKITDIEAMLSVNAVCNRATAILLSSRSSKSVVEQIQYQYSPLLQVQHRVQKLRVKILNSSGDLYDLGEDASFAIDFYCSGHEVSY
jgi:hypothetical protein